MAYTFTSKAGSMAFARKIGKLSRAKAAYLLRQREAKFGLSLWNPGYMIVPGYGPSRDAFGNPTGL